MQTRRTFVHETLSCAGHLALAAAVLPAWARRAWAAEPGARIVQQQPFGRLEQVADGVWALISNPFGGDRTTLSNGGLVAGRSGVVAIEGFLTPAGARWLAEQSRTLTGRWPTHVVCTHYHGDHANGLAGYVQPESKVVLRATAATRDAAGRNTPADAERSAALAAVEVLDPATPTRIDLGGRVVDVVPRLGHTASDVTIELESPSVVFCGDLVWNGIFPNFVDARPTALAASVRSLRRSRETRYVPGHGPMSGDAEVARYVDMLGEVEVAARRAVQAGSSPADAAAAFRFPDSLGEWTMFGPTFLPRAFEAWQRELKGS